MNDTEIDRIRARWAPIPTDGYEVRIEGDQVIVYGHAARQDPEALAAALYSAAEDVQSMLATCDKGGTQ